jgi:hypothetical protein
MNIQYEPWAESHAPQSFHRTDPTGRWSPIHEWSNTYTPIPEPKWMAWIGGVVMGCMFALMIFWGI